MPAWRPLLLTLALLPWAGCLSGPSPEPAGAPHSGASGVRPTVVALLDSGINPYHEAFQSRHGGPRVEDYLLGDATLLHLSQAGTYEERVAADAGLWAGLEVGKVYGFAGTRVLAVSIVPEGVFDPLILDWQAHGTATSSAVAASDPETLILMIQIYPLECPLHGRPECRTDPSVALAMDWAAEQPWIDVISISLAHFGNVPDNPDLHPEMRAYMEASRKAHQNGKIIVNGAGNAVVPPLGNYFNGPPWIVAVGGFEAGPKGSAPLAATQVDLVANYTHWVANIETTDGWSWSSGTSLGTPIVAATLSKAIRQVRAGLDTAELASRAEGALASGLLDGEPVAFTHEDFRDALNLSAVHYGASDWDPTNTSRNGTLALTDSESVPVLVPHAQMGWGYVEPALAPEVARRVLERDATVPPEKAEAAEWQAQYQQRREWYWSNYE